MRWPSIKLPVLLLALFLAMLPGTQAAAHESRPALLRIVERADGRVDVLWKQPSDGALALPLAPRISGGLLEARPSRITAERAFRIREWTGLPLGSEGLAGRTVSIDGLDRTLTDVLVSVSTSDGEKIQSVLRPDRPAMTLDARGSGLAASAYMRLGVEHILTGIDHLAFLLGLLLLVRGRMTLFKTITAFTVAHSITLAATVLDLISFSPALIEALVALSILFVAVEIVHFYRGREGFTVRYPWLVAFVFGLLHGSAFASGLLQAGLPADAVPLSLFLFNIGIEIGQLLFVAGMILAAAGFRRLPMPEIARLRWAPPYVIGSFAAYWFIERLQIVASA